MIQLKDALAYWRRHRQRKAVGELGELLATASPEKGQNKAPWWDPSPNLPRVLAGEPLSSPFMGGCTARGRLAYLSPQENDGLSFTQQISHGDVAVTAPVALAAPTRAPSSRWDVRSSPVPSPLHSGYPHNLQPSSITTSPPQKNDSWGASEHSAGTDTKLYSTVHWCTRTGTCISTDSSSAFPEHPVLHFHRCQSCISRDYSPALPEIPALHSHSTPFCISTDSSTAFPQIAPLHFQSTQPCIPIDSSSASPQHPALLLNTTGNFKCTFHTKPPKTIAK